MRKKKHIQDEVWRHNNNNNCNNIGIKLQTLFQEMRRNTNYNNKTNVSNHCLLAHFISIHLPSLPVAFLTA